MGLKSGVNDINEMDAPNEDEISNNPYVFSQTQAVGVHSFIDNR